MTPSTRHRITAAVLAVLILGLGAYLYRSSTATRPAPPSTFLLLDGSRTTTDDLRGQVTLVNFWATSCTTCVAEMPALAATHEKYRQQGYRTIAVAMQYDPPAYVLNFAQSRQLPFTVALDATGDIARAWGDVRVTPTTYLVNRQGHIVKTYVGQPDFSELHHLIETLLAQPA